MDTFTSKTGNKIEITAYAMLVNSYEDALEGVDTLRKRLKGKREDATKEDFTQVLQAVTHINLPMTYEINLKKEEKLRQRIEMHCEEIGLVSSYQLSDKFPEVQKQQNKELEMAETKMTFKLLKKLSISLSELLNMSGVIDENDESLLELSKKDPQKSQKIMNKYFTNLDKKKKKIVGSKKYEMLHGNGYYVIENSKKYHEVSLEEVLVFLDDVSQIIRENARIRNRRSFLK